MERPPLTDRVSFSFATTATPRESLSTWRQQLGTIWTSLDWLMVTRILKCDVAVTIAFILVLSKWGWSQMGTGMVLSTITIEFIHPAGSYGRIWEVRFMQYKLRIKLKFKSYCVLRMQRLVCLCHRLQRRGQFWARTVLMLSGIRMTRL
jgi:hypothetical protein